MISSPSSSPARAVLLSCTNLPRTPRARATSYLPTPPADKKPNKRRIVIEEKPAQKRLKLCNKDASSESEESDSESDSDGDVFMEDAAVARARARRNTAFQLHTRFIASAVPHCRRQAPSTLPILRSFVSSQKSDSYKCQSIGDDTYLTPPYACSYSHGAKNNGAPLLAIATEQGSVHVLDTRRRNDWDVEPPRTTIQPHNNGIFDVQWNLDDTSLVTCSGDQSTRISDARTGVLTHVLRGHTSTVKCAAWDPSNPSLLATGGRDGAICLWDLRVGEQLQNSELFSATPVMTIYGAHENTTIKSKPKARKGKQNPTPRTVTNVLYPRSQPYGLVSSSSFDGVLRYWDLRKATASRKTKPSRQATPSELYSSPIDPTMLHGSRRPRGIISMASGTGPSAGLIFAIGADSRVHTYDLPTLSVQSNAYSHENLQTNSFYVGLSVSPCGRWLACGGSGNKGNSFLFDVENACRPGSVTQRGVELKGHAAEVGAVDWAQDMLATCADDGVVRVWRPDLEAHLKCLDAPEESKCDWLWSADSVQ